MTDENGVAVASARVQLQPPPPALPLRCGTDFAGHCEFTDLSSGTYELRVEKTGFYAAVQPDVQVGVTANVDVTLSHQQEAREVVNVMESAPAIDPAQISTKEELTGAEIVDIPYPGPHDYRNALTFIPGVTPDAFGQAHVAGAETYQTLLLLDGFNVTQPTNGAAGGADQHRLIPLHRSDPEPRAGRVWQGFRRRARLEHTHGQRSLPVHRDRFHSRAAGHQRDLARQWTPIYTMSGPIRKGKMWFIDALDGEYDDDITKQLPSGADATTSGAWTTWSSCNPT